MNAKRYGNGFSLLVMVSLLLSLLSPASVTASPPEVPSAQESSVVIVEQKVEEEIASKGQTDFFVWMVEKADLTPAYDLKTKTEKGEFVFEALRSTAERTQQDLRAYLDSQGVDYQAFYIANKLLIRGGDAAILTDIRTRTDVSKITANHQYQLDQPLKDQPEAVESNISYVNADDVWAMGITGSGVVLAGNDTGLDETVSTIAPHYRGCLNPPGCTSWDHNYNWWDATGTYPTDPWDGFGHGTHTTGTMVGDDGGTNQIGMAPGAQTIHCKNMTDGGSGDDGTFIECFQWDLAPWDLSGANPNPAMAPDAVNNSWGYGGGNQPQFEDEIAALQAAGILVEVSAGNEGSSCGTLRSPGDYEEVLTTGSVSHEAGIFPGPVSGFSSRGPSTLYPDDFFPDIMAPGNSIRSQLPGGGFENWGGTSMAGPHATGLIALMWSASPALRGRVADTIQIIKETAAPITDYVGSCGGDYVEGPNNDWGFGTIDALAAVQLAIAMGGAGTLNGTVTSSAGGTPIEDVLIFAEHEDGYTWQQDTNAAGEYEMIVAVGMFTITASKYGWIPETVTGVEVITDTVTTQNFVLDPAPASIVDGYVTDAITGWPLYAQIDIDGYPEGPVFSDPETGYYSVSLANGTAYTFHVNAWTGGYYQEDWTSPVISGSISQDFELDVDVAACVAPGYEPNVSFMEDFEASNGGFAVDPGSINSTWAWGMPTSGPGSAYSGVNVWATNLAGNYPDYSDDYLVSPLIDLSGLGSGFRLSWAQWLQTESCCDTAYVDVSSDGGATWVSAYSAQGDVDLSWAQHSVDLDSSYAVNNFRIRFYLHTDLSVTYPGWYVDDVAVYGECSPMSGGLAIGNVYDMNTTLPINGASVTADTMESTVTAATPDDPNVDDGFYVLFVTNGPTGLTITAPAPMVEPEGGWQIAPATEDVGVEAVEPALAPTVPEALWVAPDAVLYDNGPLVTHPGGGAGGADASALQTALGMNTYGFGHALSTGYRMADDFTISDPAGWQIDQITFFAYQTGSGTGCTINHLNYQIWDGPPNAGGTIVFGDTTTNRLVGCAWSNIYRVLDTALADVARPIMADVASAGVTLPPGTYWLDWQTGGTLSSGPWASPISILGSTTTGDALQWNPTSSTWGPALDTGTTTGQGLPFVIEGSIPGGASDHELTADKDQYSPDTHIVTIPDWGVVVQDFNLGTGFLSFDPEVLDVTLEMGDTTSVDGVLSNTGSGATPFEFMEQDRGWIPTGYIEYLPMPEAAGTEGTVSNNSVPSSIQRQPYIFHGNAPQAASIIVYNDDDQHIPSPVEVALQAMGVTYTFYGNPGDPAPLDLWTNEVNTLTYDLAILAQDGWIYLDAREYTAMQNHLANGGAGIVYSWGIGYGSAQFGHPLWADMGLQFGAWLNSPANLYWWDDASPIFTSPESVPEFTQLNNLGYLAYGAKMVNIADPSTGIGGFTQDPAVGEDGVVLREDYKSLYRGLTDNLNSADQDSDGMLDAAEWWVNAVGFMLNPSVDVPWLSETPVSGTIDAGENVPVTIDFDASMLTQPGVYLANLNIANDTPYGKLTVPVTMTVTPPASYGQLDGTVISLGYCDENPVPLEGAVVTITGDSGATFVVETDADGYYMLWLDSADNPYTVAVEADEHIGDEVTGVLVPAGGGLVTEDFDLRWAAACVTATPTLLEATLDMGDTETQVVTLSNDGAADTPFAATEADQGYEPPVLSIPAYTGAPIISTEPASIGPAPVVTQSRTGEDTSTIAEMLAGVPAFAVDVYPGFNLVTFDTETPGAWTVIAPVDGSSQYFGGDFLNGDFSQLFVVDYGTNTLYTLSTTDGSVTPIGPSMPNGGESWTGLAGAPDGTLYGSATTCSNSTLYTVDPNTGTTTVIGSVTNAPCLIDIAANGSGELYGVDIVNDILVQIDPTTGAGTVIGSLGADANYAQGMDFDEESGILYWAAYTSQGELRVIDTSTGASALIGTFPGGDEVDCLAIATGGGGDVPWLSEDPISGTLDADSSLDMDVIFDAGAVPQPGDYFADLRIKTDDPVNPTAVVEAILHAVAPPDWGGVEGTVTDLGYCDDNPVPAEGAMVLMTLANGITMTMEADANGHFEWWFPAADGPVDIEVTFDEHTSGFAEDVAVVAGGTTVVDFDLRLLEPCITYTPVEIYEMVALGYSRTIQLEITNSGAAPSTFELKEQDLGYTPPGLAAEPDAGECLVAITVGYDPEQIELTNTLDELGYTWVTINTVQDAYNAGAAVIMDHSPATNLPPGDLQGWMDAGFGYIEQGDWPQYFPDAWLGAPSGTPLDIVVVDTNHELTTGLPDSWSGLGFWAYDWDQDAMGYLTDASFPNVIQAGYGSLNDRAVSYIEVGEDGRGVYLGVNVQGYLAGPNDLQLFDNALKWAGHCGSQDVPWLTEVPVSGTIDADSVISIDVTLSATDPVTQTGTYMANLKLFTEDPVADRATIPVTMVVDEPFWDMELSPETAEMTGAPNETVVYILDLHNAGNMDDVYDIEVTGVDPGWVVDYPMTLSVFGGHTDPLVIEVTIPAGWDTLPDEITVTVTSQHDGTLTDFAVLTTTMVPHQLFMPIVNRQ